MFLFSEWSEKEDFDSDNWNKSDFISKDEIH